MGRKKKEILQQENDTENSGLEKDNLNKKKHKISAKEFAKKNEKSIKVSEKLGDFDVVIDAFGQIQARYNVDDINAFLNENVDDKKLKKSKNNPENTP